MSPLERYDENGRLRERRSSVFPVAIAASAIMGLSIAFIGGGAVVIGAGGGAGTVAAPSASPPDQPTITASIVDDTSTFRLVGSTYSDNGGSPHASSNWRIFRYGQTTALDSAIASDSLDQVTFVNNTDFKADSIYSASVEYVDGGGTSTVSDTVTFTNEVAALPATLVFASSWDSATGSSDAVLQDYENKWVIAYGSSDLSVVATTTEGFPSTNYLNVDDVSGQQIDMNYNDYTFVPALSIGESVAARFYFRNVDASTSGGRSHPNYFSYNNSGYGSNTLGMWDLEAVWSSTEYTPSIPGPDENNYTLNTVALKDSVYILTIQATYSAASYISVEADVYNSSGTLLWDETDHLASGNVLDTITPGNMSGLLSSLRGYRVGTESENQDSNPMHQICCMMFLHGDSADVADDMAASYEYNEAEADWRPGG